MHAALPNECFVWRWRVVRDLTILEKHRALMRCLLGAHYNKKEMRTRPALTRRTLLSEDGLLRRCFFVGRGGTPALRRCDA